jgi:hypothetical protein
MSWFHLKALAGQNGMAPNGPSTRFFKLSVYSGVNLALNHVIRFARLLTSIELAFVTPPRRCEAGMCA